MWDQIRVDNGNEFYLLLYVQEKMANYRSNTRRAPFIQTMSKEVSSHNKVSCFCKKDLTKKVHQEICNEKKNIVDNNIIFTSKSSAVNCTLYRRAIFFVFREVYYSTFHFYNFQELIYIKFCLLFYNRIIQQKGNGWSSMLGSIIPLNVY